MNECPSTGRPGGDALSLLRDAVRHARGPACVNVLGLRQQQFSRQQGGLCVKGWAAADTLAHPDRLLNPLMRNAGGALVETTWAAALDRVAGGIQRVQARHGADAVGVFGSGALTNEKAYLLGKFARVALGTSNIDYNGRFCMSSAAAAATRAFGLDRGLPFPLEDIGHSNVVLLVGSNVAETMPPLMQYFSALRANGGQLLVIDPRRSATAEWASTHLPFTSGVGRRVGQRDPSCPDPRSPDRHLLYRQPDRRIRRGAAARRDVLA